MGRVVKCLSTFLSTFVYITEALELIGYKQHLDRYGNTYADCVAGLSKEIGMKTFPTTVVDLFLGLLLKDTGIIMLCQINNFLDWYGFTGVNLHCCFLHKIIREDPCVVHQRSRFVGKNRSKSVWCTNPPCKNTSKQQKKLNSSC